MTVNLAGPKNNSQYVLRSVLKGGSCMIAGDSDGNEPSKLSFLPLYIWFGVDILLFKFSQLQFWAAIAEILPRHMQ